MLSQVVVCYHKL